MRTYTGVSLQQRCTERPAPLKAPTAPSSSRAPKESGRRALARWQRCIFVFRVPAIPHDACPRIQLFGDVHMSVEFTVTEKAELEGRGRDGLANLLRRNIKDASDKVQGIMG